MLRHDEFYDQFCCKQYNMMTSLSFPLSLLCIFRLCDNQKLKKASPFPLSLACHGCERFGEIEHIRKGLSIRILLLLTLSQLTKAFRIKLPTASFKNLSSS